MESKDQPSIEEVKRGILAMAKGLRPWVLPVLRAIHGLGGVAPNREVRRAAVRLFDGVLTPAQQEHAYQERLTFVQIGIKDLGLLQTDRGVWTITELGRRFVEETADEPLVAPTDLRDDYAPSSNKATDARLKPLREALPEYLAFCATEAGRAALAAYPRARMEGKTRFARIVAASERGEDVTEKIWRELIPRRDQGDGEELDVWVHPSSELPASQRVLPSPSPSLTDGDARLAGLTLLKFLQSTVDNPDALPPATKKLSSSSFGTMFSIDLVSPMLNALRPDAYSIVNATVVDFTNQVTSSNFEVKLDDYPAINRAVLELSGSLQDDLGALQDPPDDLTLSDLFDCFCQWSRSHPVAFADEPSVWKIAPGAEGANWERCRNEGYIGLGWAEYGDLSGVDRAELERRRADLGLNAHSLEQVWALKSKVRVGDTIVANRGIQAILGLGRVVKEYYYVPGVEDPHRIGVEWYDTRVRAANLRGWRNTLLKIERSRLDEILAESSDLTPPFNRIFASVESTRPLFEFAHKSLLGMDVRGPDDPRLSATIPEGSKVINIILGLWYVLRLSRDTVGMTLTEEEPALSLAVRWEHFSISDEAKTAWFILPASVVLSPPPELAAQFERSFGIISRRLAPWRGTPFGRFRRKDVLDAIFDPTRVAPLLTGSAPTPDPVEPTVVDDGYIEPDFAQIRESIRNVGLRISDRQVRCYHVALKTRGFVILAGVSGTGKTWLAKAYADAVGAECLVVPVAPNWTTNEDLLGYRNPLDGLYHDTQFSAFLRKAAAKCQQCLEARVDPPPFHVVLDEMNLARVEYYFARFLSALELRARSDATEIELAPGDRVVLPKNLSFVGTVNVDETTHGFADKVYDRAQLIELEMHRDQIVAHMGNDEVAQVLKKAWEELRPVAPFAYRVIDDIRKYVTTCLEMDVPWHEALDEQFVQKLLPKIRGADPRLGQVLDNLDQLARDHDLKLTSSKIASMRESFTNHGFASYF